MKAQSKRQEGRDKRLKAESSRLKVQRG